MKKIESTRIQPEQEQTLEREIVNLLSAHRYPSTTLHLDVNSFIFFTFSLFFIPVTRSHVVRSFVQSHPSEKVVRLLNQYFFVHPLQYANVMPLAQQQRIPPTLFFIPSTAGTSPTTTAAAAAATLIAMFRPSSLQVY